MDNILRQFNETPNTKQAVLYFIETFIAQEGVRRIYAKEDVTGVRDAHELIKKAFDQLAIEYGSVQKPTTQTNQSK